MALVFTGKLRPGRSWVSATLTSSYRPRPDRKYFKHPNISVVSVSAAGRGYFSGLLSFIIIIWLAGPPSCQTISAVQTVGASWPRRTVQTAALISPGRSRPGWRGTVRRSWPGAPGPTVTPWWRWSTSSPPSCLADTASCCRPSRRCCSTAPPAGPAVTASTLWRPSDWDRQSWLHRWTSRLPTGREGVRRQEPGDRG